MGTKISIIGAGTAVFSLNLLKDICLTPVLADSTVSLMDIDEERLDSAHQLCCRYAAELGIKLRIEKTTDRRASIAGANFVIHAALVGGHQRMKDGMAIAKKHGYRFGGSLHVMHDEGFWINYGQLVLMEEVLQEVLELSPQAWFMLVANPVSAGVTYLQRKYPNANIVGFCHGSNGIYRIAETLELDVADITFEMPGVNHFIWLTKFYYKGKDAFPVIDEWIRTKSADYFGTCTYSDEMGPKVIDLYQKFGAFPIGDTGDPGGGAWPYWYHTSEEVERHYKEDPEQWFAQYFKNGEDKVKRINNVAANLEAKVTDSYPPVRSQEPMITFIEAILSGNSQIITLNILNSGSYVPGVPLNFQVEVPCYVNSSGIRGIQTNGLPASLTQYVLRDRVAPIEMELSAFEQGSYELLLQLIMMDPWTTSEEQAKAMLHEILEMPGMEPMKQHYR